MLNDLPFMLDKDMADKAVADAKELFGENLPYTVEYRLNGRTIMFNDHFIKSVREALSTDCMAKMNAAEIQLFERFIAYQNGSMYRDITKSDNEVVKALDEWLMDDLNCKSHPVVNECYDAEFTYSGCS